MNSSIALLFIVKVRVFALCHNSCHLEQDGTGDDLWLGIAPRYGIQFLKSCFHQKIEQQHHWPGNTIYR